MGIDLDPKMGWFLSTILLAHFVGRFPKTWALYMVGSSSESVPGMAIDNMGFCQIIQVVRPCSIETHSDFEDAKSPIPHCNAVATHLNQYHLGTIF